MRYQNCELKAAEVIANERYALYCVVDGIVCIKHSFRLDIDNNSTTLVTYDGNNPPKIIKQHTLPVLVKFEKANPSKSVNNFIKLSLLG